MCHVFTGSGEGASRDKEGPHSRVDLQQGLLGSDFTLITKDVVNVVLLNTIVIRSVGRYSLQVESSFSVVNGIWGEIDFRAGNDIECFGNLFTLHQLGEFGGVSTCGDASDRDVSTCAEGDVVALWVASDDATGSTWKRERRRGVGELSRVGAT
jgi:hypothetical protein